MTDNLKEMILHDVGYVVNDNNKNIIESVLKNTKQNLEYIWDKIPSLVQKIEHTKGYVSISNKKNKIKIRFDKSSLSKEIENEFYEICQKWERKYKIQLNYEIGNGYFYID